MPDPEGTIAQVMSDVLTNRNPPYSIRGGLFDALQATDGQMYGVSNTAGATAMRLVRDTVGIDLDPAAAVATASLVQAVEKDIIGPDDHILLNLTGGGYERIREDFALHPVSPSATITPGEPQEELVRILMEWIAHHG
jgi:cysteate synthase